MSVYRSRTSTTNINGKRQGSSYTKCKAMPLSSKIAVIWMTSIGLLTISILFLSNQQTRLAVENGHQMGSKEDRDSFIDHYQLPHALKEVKKVTVDENDSETEPDGSQEESSGRRGRPRREKKPRKRKGKRDEKTSKALAANDDNSQQQKVQKYRERWHKDRPPLESLVTEKGGLQGDVSPLLDFAILGHAKCATVSIAVYSSCVYMRLLAFAFTFLSH